MKRRRAVGASVTIVLGLAVVTIASSACNAYLKTLPAHDAWLAGSEFTYEYEITGLRSLPDRSLHMTLELHFDAMPDLHVDRATFRSDERVVAELEPFDNLWGIPFDPEYPDFPAIPPRFNAVSPEWETVFEQDGDALRDLFGGWGDYRYFQDLRDFESLPETETTYLTLRLVRAD